MTRELPPSEWESFFKAFTMQHDRWLVTVESSRDGERRVAADKQPLEGILARLHNGNGREIIITVGGNRDSHKRFAISDPVRVRVESDNGADRALQIEGSDGTVTRVAFQSAIAPELVDGILP
jgi:hypothetical protein